jgi:hypothetical protein
LNGKSVGAHEAEIFRDGHLQGVDSREDAHERHNPESNNEDGENRPQTVSANGCERHLKILLNQRRYKFHVENDEFQIVKVSIFHLKEVTLRRK